MVKREDMQGIEKKSHYMGEVLVIMSLQVIMLLFRLVEPIHWENLFPGQYTHFINEFAYFGIEFILVICIVAHGSFSIPFNELGLTHIRENLGSLIINICYLIGGTVVAYLMSQFSRKVEFNAIWIICQFVTNFIAIAFLKEVIFRGFLFRALYHLTNGKGVIASLLTAVLFAVTYIPDFLITLDQVSTIHVIQKLIIPFALGLYLSLLYYYGRNLWTCCLVHGVMMSFGYLEQDFILVSIEILYMVILLGYLIYKSVQYYQENKKKDSEENQVVARMKEYDKNELEHNKKIVEKISIEERVKEQNDKQLNKETTWEDTRSDIRKEIEPVVNGISEKSITKKTIISPIDEKKIEEDDQQQDKGSVPDLFSVLNQEIEEDEELNECIVTLNTKAELKKEVYVTQNTRNKA